MMTIRSFDVSFKVRKCFQWDWASAIYFLPETKTIQSYFWIMKRNELEKKKPIRLHYHHYGSSKAKIANWLTISSNELSEFSNSKTTAIDWTSSSSFWSRLTDQWFEHELFNQHISNREGKKISRALMLILMLKRLNLAHQHHFLRTSIPHGRPLE